MNAILNNRLGSVGNKQNFVEELDQVLAPYGQVKRSQLLVEEDYPISEISCFVEMATPQQAVAAHNDLNMPLLDDKYLFFSVKHRGNFIE